LPALSAGSLPAHRRRRAAELEKKIAELEEAGQYAEAFQVAEELQSLRRRVHGADQHEAVSVKWQTGSLRKVAALPAEHRADWRAALRSESEARDLELLDIGALGKEASAALFGKELQPSLW
jgi:hypothetical protein